MDNEDTNIVIRAYVGRVDIQIGNEFILKLQPDAAARLAFSIMECRDVAVSATVD